MCEGGGGIFFNFGLKSVLKPTFTQTGYLVHCTRRVATRIIGYKRTEIATENARFWELRIHNTVHPAAHHLAAELRALRAAGRRSQRREHLSVRVAALASPSPVLLRRVPLGPSHNRAVQPPPSLEPRFRTYELPAHHRPSRRSLRRGHPSARGAALALPSPVLLRRVPLGPLQNRAVQPPPGLEPRFRMYELPAHHRPSRRSQRREHLSARGVALALPSPVLLRRVPLGPLYNRAVQAPPCLGPRTSSSWPARCARSRAASRCALRCCALLLPPAPAPPARLGAAAPPARI